MPNLRLVNDNVIDAALRFVRSNPELVRFAEAGAPGAGRSVDALLADAVARFRSAQPVMQQQQVAGASHAPQLRVVQCGRGGGVSGDQPRARVRRVASGELR